MTGSPAAADVPRAGRDEEPHRRSAVLDPPVATSPVATPAVVRLDDATDAARFGHKAANLAVLRRAGLPVPDGVVLPASAPAPDEAAGTVPGVLLAAVRGWGGVPLAVRSSGTAEDSPQASFAGLYTTVLDVRGEAALCEAVARCRASAAAPRVGAYAGSAVAPAVAVLVQPMVPAAAAGVAFTADPVTGDRGVVVLDAARGVGERLVSGAVTPERWEVRAGPQRRSADADAVIDAATAATVADLARRAERALGRPQDVEWAVTADGEVVVLQSRPITTLARRTGTPVPVPIEPPEGFWTRETSHAPLPWTPFTRVVLAPRNRALEQICTELGLLFQAVEFREIGGWEYMRIVPLGGREPPPLPAWAAPLALRLVPALRRRIRNSIAAVRSDVPGTLIERWHREWRPDLDARAAALRDVDLTTLDDTALLASTQTALELTGDGQTIHFRLHGAIAMVLGELAAVGHDLLGWDVTRVLDLLAGTSRTSTAPARALAGVAALVRERPAVRRLVEDGAGAEQVLAADRAVAEAFEGHLRTYGCRVLRYEVAEPSLEERPDLVLALLRDQLATGFDPDAADAALRARRAATRTAAEAALAGRSRADSERFARALGRALRAYPVREDNEASTISTPFALLRRAVREIGRRLAARGLLADPDDAFLLEPEELLAALREGADRRELADHRAREQAWVLAHPGPASYGEAPAPPPPLSALPAGARASNEAFLWAVEQILGPPAAAGGGSASRDTAARDGVLLPGIPASAGSYTGPVRIVRSEADFDRVRAGDVLVCPVTSPVWSVLFPSIGALVTDVGGTLSHPAIIAREYGLPAVVATVEGTTRLHDDQLVTVDGSTGTVRAVR
jgi:pyruvate,water dikinase